MTRKSVSLSLSGGGARGLAHIGVIKAIEEFEMDVKAVSGTSAGAIVAYMLAAGLKSHEMADIAKKNKFYSAFKMSLSKIGLVSMENLTTIFKKYIEVSDFEKLEIPLHVSVTNLRSGSVEYIHKGNIHNAVVASCSIPMIFSPVTMNEELYADGGLIDNLPIEPLEKLDYDIIGVNIMGDGTGKIPDSFAQLVDRTIDIVAWQNTKRSLEKCKYPINILEAHKYGIFDFKKVDELVELGYNEALKIFKKEPDFA